jgi:hypothetical protein
MLFKSNVRLKSGCKLSTSSTISYPVVSILSPTTGSSVYWGDILSVNIFAYSTNYSPIGVVKIYIGDPISGGIEIGSRIGQGVITYQVPVTYVGSITLYATAVNGDGLTTVSNGVSITVVNPIVELGGTWWDLTQNTTIVDASVAAFDTWALQRITKATVGAITTVTENIDATPTSHTLYKTPTNLEAGPTSVAVVVQGRADRMAVQIVVGGGTVAFSLTSAGSVISSSGATTFISHLGDGWYLCAIHSIFTTGNVNIRPTLSDGTYVYIGDGREAFSVRAPTEIELELVNAGVLQGILTQRRTAQVTAKTGSLGALAQATPANQPFLWNDSNSTWTQIRGLRFFIDDHLNVTAAINQPWTAFYVVDFDTISTNVIAGSSTDHTGIIYANAGVYSLDDFAAIATTASASTNKELVVARHNTTSSFVRVNGTQSEDVSSGSNNVSVMRIGSNSVATNGAKGHISDVIIIPGAISTANIQLVERAIAMLRSITII